MSAFRRVEGQKAGPAALGVLAPPGRRTFLILRPRALPWDLVLLQPAHPSAFHEMDRDEATAAAEEVVGALETWASGGPGRVETADAPHGAGVWVRVHAGPFALLLCPRAPGQPYQAQRPSPTAPPPAPPPPEFVSVLHPSPGAPQELYFNTRHFLR